MGFADEEEEAWFTASPTFHRGFSPPAPSTPNADPGSRAFTLSAPKSSVSGGPKKDSFGRYWTEWGTQIFVESWSIPSCCRWKGFMSETSISNMVTSGFVGT